jgi:hypothetical protein
LRLLNGYVPTDERDQGVKIMKYTLLIWAAEQAATHSLEYSPLQGVGTAGMLIPLMPIALEAVWNWYKKRKSKTV